MPTKFYKAKYSLYETSAPYAQQYLSRSAFRNIRVGDLAHFLASEINASCQSFASAFERMRLVSVRSDFSGYEFGSYESGARGFNYLVFSFALGHRTTWLSPPYLRVRSHNVFVSVHGNSVDSNQYVTIRMRQEDVLKYGVANMQPRALRYLFYAVGLVMRGMFRRKSRFLHGADDTHRYHERMENQLHGAVPLTRVFDLHYERWIWQRTMWKHCPNLFASSLVNPTSTARILDVLSGVHIDRVDAAHALVFEEHKDNHTHTSVFDLVQRSLVRFASAVNSQDYSTPDKMGLLFPALLYSLLFRGEVGYEHTIEKIYPNMVMLFNERGYDLVELFEPFDDTVRLMLAGDSTTVERLTSAIDLF